MITKKTMTNAAEDTGKGDVYTLLVTQPLWKSVEVPQSTKKIEQPNTPSLSLLGIYPKDSTHAGQKGEKSSAILPSNEH